jgi:hypothetical protein
MEHRPRRVSRTSAHRSGTFVVKEPNETEMVDSAGEGSRPPRDRRCCPSGPDLPDSATRLPPNGLLADIVFRSGSTLSTFRGWDPAASVEFEVALATTLSVVIFGVGWGSSLPFSFPSWHTSGTVPPQLPAHQRKDGGWVSSPDSGQQVIEGLVIYRFGSDLLYQRGENDRRSAGYH